MTKYAIQVENLGKEYIIGGAEQRHDSFREMLTGALTSPFRKLRRLRGTASEKERFWALKNVSFEVQHGEVIGVIGRNGAGKSTLLKILSRITSPTTGKVRLQGRVASLLEVGTGFHPELTGRENIFLNGSILGMSRNEIEKKFNEIVTFAGIEKFIDTPVKRYSSGMYVRLAFAVAAHLEPEILVVDEVLAVGDAAFQKKCLNKMEDVAGQGRTVLFVSHNMVSIRRLCDRTILLENGCLVAFDETSRVIQRYHQKSVGSNTSVAFSPDQHRTQTEFEISQVTIVNKELRPLTVIRAGEQFGFEVSVRSTVSLGNIYLAIEIHLDGINLASFWQEGASVRANTTKLLICMLREGVLKPGFYDVHMGATDIDSGRPLDWIPDAMSFQIAESNVLDEKASHERDGGLIKIPYSWADRSVIAEK